MKIAVTGGGIAGNLAAHHLSPDHQATLSEARVGSALRLWLKTVPIHLHDKPKEAPFTATKQP